MNNVWLVRPCPHGNPRITEFKRDNIVAIGWPGIGDLTKKSREDIKQILSGSPYKLSGLALGNACATIDIFVNRMEIGDIALVPDGGDIFFAEICGNYYMDSKFDSDQMGYPHQRKVKWLQNVTRDELSKSLRSSLKVHRTTADLSKHHDEIDALSHGKVFNDRSAKKVETVRVSYPLRVDFTVNFELPTDITRDEAKKLAHHLETLYYAE